jgi:hypothetical protein
LGKNAEAATEPAMTQPDFRFRIPD